MGHSFNQIVKLWNARVYFFFPRKSSWAIHSGSGGFFFIFFESGLCFFFHIFWYFFVFFFSCKSSHVIHSFDLEAVFFFRRWKKNTAFSFIQSIFPQNVKKMNFYSKKKNTIPLLRYNMIVFFTLWGKARNDKWDLWESVMGRAT